MNWCALTYEEEKESHYKSASSKSLIFQLIKWFNDFYRKKLLYWMWCGGLGKHLWTPEFSSHSCYQLMDRILFPTQEKAEDSCMRKFKAELKTGLCRYWELRWFCCVWSASVLDGIWDNHVITVLDWMVRSEKPQHFFPNSQNTFGMLSSSSLNRRKQFGVQEFIPSPSITQEISVLCSQEGWFFFFFNGKQSFLYLPLWHLPLVTTLRAASGGREIPEGFEYNCVKE